MFRWKMNLKVIFMRRKNFSPLLVISYNFRKTENKTERNGNWG